MMGILKVQEVSNNCAGDDLVRSDFTYVAGY